jgi:hypothetical protein
MDAPDKGRLTTQVGWGGRVPDFITQCRTEPNLKFMKSMHGGWCTPESPALGRLWQEELEFKTSLDKIGRYCLKQKRNK